MVMLGETLQLLRGAGYPAAAGNGGGGEGEGSTWGPTVIWGVSEHW